MQRPPLIAALALLAPLSGAAAAEGAFHELSFDEALAAARAAEKVVFVDFFTTWCGPCKKLDEVTWKDAGVVEWLQAKTIALKIDAEKEVELARRFEVQAYPTLVFVRPDGSVMGRVLGYRGPEDFLVLAADTLAGISRSDRVRIQLEEAGGLDTQLQLELGRELLGEGRHEEALEHLLWCWDNGLDHDPGFLGVRSSFLLADLVRLAKVYPPAGAALRARRDACREAVLALADDPLAARDLATLNDRLAEQASTLATYEALVLPPDADDTTRRRYEIARETLFEHVLDLLLEQRRYAEVVRAVGDPVRSFESRLAVFQSDEPADESQQQMANAFRRRAIVEGAQHLEALLGVGEREQARLLADAILTTDPGYGTYKLLIAHATRSGDDQAADELLARAKQQLSDKYHRRLEGARRRG